MAPQFVKPYVKSQKNDANDAEAICEAVTRPNMRFVFQKSVEQQDLQCLHRVRSRLVANRTQLINQIRGLLAEYGIVLPQHTGQVRSGLPTVLEDAENQLPGFGRDLFRSLYEEQAQLDEKIADADHRIQLAFQNIPDCRRIAAVEGVGPLSPQQSLRPSATAMPSKMDVSFQHGWGSCPSRTPAAVRVGSWGSASAATRT
jgi:transposase